MGISATRSTFDFGEATLPCFMTSLMAVMPFFFSVSTVDARCASLRAVLKTSTPPSRETLRANASRPGTSVSLASSEGFQLAPLWVARFAVIQMLGHR